MVLHWCAFLEGVRKGALTNLTIPDIIHNLKPYIPNLKPSISNPKYQTFIAGISHIFAYKKPRKNSKKV
jgi:hypothetical protein